MFVTIDLVHKEAPAFWTELPGQDVALGWVAMSLSGNVEQSGLLLPWS